MRFYVRGTAKRAHILTGAPGTGKLRVLETLGYLVAEEAATDVIALENALGRDEPWEEPGFTAARRISFADSLAFERVHEETYRDLGFRLVDIPWAVPGGPLPNRVALIEQAAGVCP